MYVGLPLPCAVFFVLCQPLNEAQRSRVCLNWYGAAHRMASERASASSSKEQLDRALAGERSALSELVLELTPVIQARVARTVLRSRIGASALRHEIEDLTQEVFVGLFSKGAENLRAWDPAAGLSLRNFVGLLAQRRVLNILRSRRLSPFANEPTDPQTIAELSESVAEDGGRVEAQAEARQTLEHIADELSVRLSPKALEMFYRLFVWQQSPDVIAEQTGLRTDAIYQWRSRLRKTANELGDELRSRAELQPESAT